MPEPDTSQTRTPQRWWPLPRYQFSLARLMITVTLVAILVWFATKVGSFISVVLFSFFACAIPTPIVICAVYARGDTRAFAIGALVPWIVAFRLAWPDPYGAFLEMIWLLMMGTACGVIAVVTRRWIERNRPNQ
jgi:hypothetical protein